jgi:Fatty acid hydroxylase superfamily
MTRPKPHEELERTAAARDRMRTKMLAQIPRWYRPFGHLAATVGIGLFVLAVAVHELGRVRPLEWLIVPITALLGNLLEYRLHKYALHRRRWPFKILYDRHTPEHHAIYMTEDMSIRSTREFRLVLIPAFGVAALVVGTLPFAWFTSFVFGPNAGWLFIVTSAFVLVSYEVLHLTYHLPPESFVGRRWIIRVLRRHHATHHDPRLMYKWNFNVTVPLFDWFLGTTYDPQKVDSAKEVQGAQAEVTPSP